MKIPSSFICGTSLTGHLILVFLGLSLLMNVGCQQEAKDVDRGPSRIDLDTTFEPERVLEQEGIDSIVPDWSDTHTAWRIEWEGARAARLTIERYRRGDCFIRASYRYIGEGELRKTALNAISTDDGNEASSEDSVLAGFLERLSRNDEGLFSRQDSFGRLVWTFEIESAREDSNIGAEIMGSVTYEDQPCFMAPVLMSRDVPAKQRPVR